MSATNGPSSASSRRRLRDLRIFQTRPLRFFFCMLKNRAAPSRNETRPEIAILNIGRVDNDPYSLHPCRSPPLISALA
jgi:hypothetical protein